MGLHQSHAFPASNRCNKDPLKKVRATRSHGIIVEQFLILISSL